MWISQTYLGSTDPESKVFLYYFWEDYTSQKSIPPQILEGLSDLGYEFRDQVSAFAPMDKYVEMIREEMRGKFSVFWRNFQGRTPGIFLSRKPLRDFDPQRDDWLFFEIKDDILDNKETAVKFFSKLHEICRDIIDHQYDEVEDTNENSFFETLYESAQLKLTFMGAGIDFKPLLARFARRPR